MKIRKESSLVCQEHSPCMTDRGQHWDGQGFSSNINSAKGKIGCWADISLLLHGNSASPIGLVIKMKYKPRNSSRERASVQRCSGQSLLCLLEERKISARKKKSTLFGIPWLLRSFGSSGTVTRNLEISRTSKWVGSLPMDGTNVKVNGFVPDSWEVTCKTHN